MQLDDFENTDEHGIFLFLPHCFSLFLCNMFIDLTCTTVMKNDEGVNSVSTVLLEGIVTVYWMILKGQWMAE